MIDLQHNNIEHLGGMSWVVMNLEIASMISIMETPFTIVVHLYQRVTSLFRKQEI